MKILITGAAGFIGSHLFTYLRDLGHEVRGIDNFSHPCGMYGQQAIKYGDIRYQQDLEKHIMWATKVYHLAAQIHVDKSITHVQETLDVNIMGTYNVLELCKKYGKQIVFASTSEVYGTTRGKIDENSPTHAQSPYAVSKLACDKLCGNYHNLYQTKVWRLRVFNTYGPWQNAGSYGAVIPIFVRQAIQDNGHLTIYGDGKQKRDFLYIDDCVKMYSVITEHGALLGDVINIGSGASISINDLGKKICKIVGVPFRPTYLKGRPGEVRKLEADIKEARKFGFEPTVDIDDGLDRYINWYKDKYEK